MAEEIYSIVWQGGEYAIAQNQSGEFFGNIRLIKIRGKESIVVSGRDGSPWDAKILVEDEIGNKERVRKTAESMLKRLLGA